MKFGHIRDYVEHVRDDNMARPVGVLIGDRVQSNAASVDWRAASDPVYDQGNTNTCVAQAFVGAATLISRIQYAEIEKPSIPALYALSHLIDRPGSPYIPDDGRRPRSVLEAASRFGLVANARWAFGVVDLTIPPPLDVHIHGHIAKLTGWYRADSGDVVASLRHALQLGHIPIFAMEVDADYMNLRGDRVYEGLVGPSYGSHMQSIEGYDDDRAAFLVRNSWGPTFGDDGYAWVSYKYMRSPNCFDRHVMTVVPTVIH